MLCDTSIQTVSRSYPGLRERLRGRGRWKIHSSSFLLTVSTEAWEYAMAEACFYSKKAEFGLRFCLGIKVRDISYIHIIIINQKSKNFIWFYNLPETSRVGIRQQCEDLQKSHYINFSPHCLEEKSMRRLVQDGGVEGHALSSPAGAAKRELTSGPPSTGRWNPRKQMRYTQGQRGGHGEMIEGDHRDKMSFFPYKTKWKIIFIKWK